jgi:hypothetical protein
MSDLLKIAAQKHGSDTINNIHACANFTTTIERLQVTSQTWKRGMATKNVWYKFNGYGKSMGSL